MDETGLDWLSIGDNLHSRNALKLPIGYQILASWYDQGLRSAVAEVTAVKPEVPETKKAGRPAAIDVNLFPLAAAKPVPLRLIHTDNRFGVFGDRILVQNVGNQREYLLRSLTDKERITIEQRKRIGTMRKQGVAEDEVVELTPKEVMHRLLEALTDEPMGSKSLAKAAGIEYSDICPEIMKRLYQAGKVGRVIEEGKAKYVRKS